MQTYSMLIRSAFALLVFCLCSLIAFPLKAELIHNRVMDATHILDEKTHQHFDLYLAEVAAQGRADITVFLVNQYTQNQVEFTQKMISEWESKAGSTLSPQKRAYLIINVSSHKGMIVLGKEAKINDSLAYTLREIQQKILGPHLIEKDVKGATLMAAQGMVGALEDWPSAPSTLSFFNGSVVDVLKWLAELSLIMGLLFGLRLWFLQPKWQDLPINNETFLLLNEQASLDLAYWRTHRHIESV